MKSVLKYLSNPRYFLFAYAVMFLIVAIITPINILNNGGYIQAELGGFLSVIPFVIFLFLSLFSLIIFRLVDKPKVEKVVAIILIVLFSPFIIILSSLLF